jgi:diguanylate cyclase (GGDEF)-like protein/PAS domain S-box-containing protein
VFGTVEAPPFSMRERGGVLRGYLKDYLAALEERSDLRFEVRFFDSLAELKQALNDGVVDVAGPVMQTASPVVRAMFTRPLERLPIALVSGPMGPSHSLALDSLAGKRVGILQAGTIDGFGKVDAGARYVGFDSDVDALEALANARVDFVAMEENRAVHYIEKLGLSRFTLPGRLPIHFEPALAVGMNRPTLFPDLTRAMQTLPAHERAKIRDSWLEPAEGRWYKRGGVLAAFGAAVLLLLTSSFFSVKFWVRARARGARLVHSERMHRALSASISDMVTLHGADGAILYASPSTLALTGHDPEALAGKYFTDLLHPDDKPAMVQAAKAMNREREQRRTLRLKCKHGEYRFFECIGKLFNAGKRGEFVVVSRDVTERTRVLEELRAAQERFRFLAYHDARTGLPNRSHLMAGIEEVLGSASNDSRSLSLLFLDIDNLKTVNDVHGYAVGDTVIDALASRLKSATDGLCELTRLGGDEFGALVRHDEPHELEKLAAIMMNACAQPIDVRGSALYLTASVGIARYPQDGADGEELLAAAAIALRTAKSAGKNLWRYFDFEARRCATHQALSLQQLRTAFERGEFMLHYQPKVALASGAVVGYEALLRWNSPLGMQGAGELIAVAEQSGFVATLGEWVTREAARQSLAWRHRGMRCPIAVNVSAMQLHDERLVAALRALTVRDSELPELLVLELTETAVATDIDRARRVLDEIAALGFAMHIDDFGTGYSSLARLSRLPISALKIDRSFVAGTPDDAEACEIVKAIMALARALRLEAIAEGVETAAQVQFLRYCGCEQAQGFFYGAAMVPEKALAFWQQHRAAQQAVVA